MNEEQPVVEVTNEETPLEEQPVVEETNEETTIEAPAVCNCWPSVKQNGLCPHG